MALASGKYLPKQVKDVVVWRKPDANGPGEEVWQDDMDQLGRVVGRSIVRDQNGNPVKLYPAPTGFKNLLTSDRQDCYVYYKDNGDIYRQPNGEAVNIKPGQAVVFEPDGSVSYLDDEYAQYMFGNNHDALNTASN